MRELIFIQSYNLKEISNCKNDINNDNNDGRL